MASTIPSQTRQVYGIDFSGAAQAGKKIWITSGQVEGGALLVAACYRAQDLPSSGTERDRCLAALRDFIARERCSAFGLDFPFGLPRKLVKESTWESFVSSFPERYASPGAFRESCRIQANKSELKRITDKKKRTPFSPYNIRLYRQTYYGIRDVLAPLVQDGLACVLPMQQALVDRPWVLEICPASTLKCEKLSQSYKGKSRQHYQARAHILKELEASAPLVISDPTLRAIILDDPQGDALDSIVAAFAVFRVLGKPDGRVVNGDPSYALEGYVYA